MRGNATTTNLIAHPLFWLAMLGWIILPAWLLDGLAKVFKVKPWR